MVRRMFRVAKYAAIGAAVAFVGTGVLGALGTGIAWFAAPSMGMGIGMGVTWALVKVSRVTGPQSITGGGGMRAWLLGGLSSGRLPLAAAALPLVASPLAASHRLPHPAVSLRSQLIPVLMAAPPRALSRRMVERDG